jgi:hypothetical protein
MTEAFDRTRHRVAEPRYFADLAVGERSRGMDLNRARPGL